MLMRMQMLMLVLKQIRCIALLLVVVVSSPDPTIPLTMIVRSLPVQVCAADVCRIVPAAEVQHHPPRFEGESCRGCMQMRVFRFPFWILFVHPIALGRGIDSDDGNAYDALQRL